MNKVSVVVPAYNAEKYLEETLRSVRTQSLKPYEIIVVNDASTDNTVRIALRNKARVLTHKVNMGIGCSRQDGAEAAEGDYVAFLSSDDVWHPSFLEKTFKWAAHGVRRTDFAVFTNHCRCDSFLNVQSIFEAPRSRYGDQNTFISFVIDWALRKNMFVNFSCVLIPREVFDTVKFQPDLRHGEDLIFLLDSVLSGLQWIHVKSALLLYRIHGSQGTRLRDRDEWFLLWSYIIDRLQSVVDLETLKFAYEQSYRNSFPSLLERSVQKYERLKCKLGIKSRKKSFAETKSLCVHNRKE